MNRHQKTFHLLSISLLLGLTVLLYQMAGMDSETAVAASHAAPDWTTPITITTSAMAPFGVNFPAVTASPDGQSVMVVFNKARSLAEGDNDPYFSRSLDNGETWSTPEAITETVDLSGQIFGAYDPAGVAHVAWKEGTGLAYAKEGTANSGDWTDPFEMIVPTGTTPGVTNPYLVASENNLVDVVWAQGVGGTDPNIYHARSRDGGSNWPIQGIITSTLESSQFPSMAVDSSGTIHAVWQELDNLLFNPPRFGGTIYYVQGIEMPGNIISWSERIEISTVDDAREPEIIVNGSRLRVTYTDFVNLDEQFVRFVQCSGQCTDEDNWVTELNPISGQLVGANGADPLNVVTSLVQRGPCSTVYFHGTADGLVDNEIIWGTSSCQGWSQSAREQVTSSNFRSINPGLAVQNNAWLYLVYEQGVTFHQIYLHRNIFSDIFLPIILKN